MPGSENVSSLIIALRLRIRQLFSNYFTSGDLKKAKKSNITTLFDLVIQFFLSYGIIQAHPDIQCVNPAVRVSYETDQPVTANHQEVTDMRGTLSTRLPPGTQIQTV